MCIPSISERVARKLLEHFGDMLTLREALGDMNSFPRVRLDARTCIGKARLQVLADLWLENTRLAQGMLRCGKRAGAHFHDVAATDKQYCGWVLRERAEGRALPRDLKQFASYLRREHGGVVAVGKHRGSFFPVRPSPGLSFS